MANALVCVPHSTGFPTCSHSAHQSVKQKSTKNALIYLWSVLLALTAASKKEVKSNGSTTAHYCSIRYMTFFRFFVSRVWFLSVTFFFQVRKNHHHLVSTKTKIINSEHMDLSGSQFINFSSLWFCHFHCTITVTVNIKLYNYYANSVSVFQSNIHLCFSEII